MSVDRRDGELAEKLKQPVMALRIIVMALASGVVTFAAVAIVIRAGGEPGEEWKLLTWTAIGAAPIALVVSRLLPAVIAGSARAQIAAGNHGVPQGSSGHQAFLSELGDAGALYGVYQTKTIVSAAVLEGAAFFSVTAFLLEGAWIALGVGVGLAAVILALFPSARRAAEWVQQQLRRIDEERLLGR